MSKVNSLASKIVDSAGAFKNKTEEFIRNMDSKMEIDRIENEIDNLYIDIGEMVCRYLDSGEKLSIGGEITEKHKKIQILKKGILNKKKVLTNTMRDAVYCENCGEIIQKGTRYCPFCGKNI